MFGAEEQAKFFKIMSAHSQEGMLIADAQNKILWVNPAFSRITGYAESELLGQSPNLLKSGRHPADFYREMWSSLAQSGYWKGEIWNRRKNGDVYPESLSICAVLDEKKKVRYYTAQISDLTQLKQYQKSMEAELNLARRIQQKLLPQKTPVIPGLKIAAYYQPMQAVGGDFYDFIEFSDTDCLGIFISDSSGHGVPAAFITSMVKSVLENSFTAHFFPGHLLQTINEKLLGKTDDGFLTAFYGLLNYHNGKFIFARAGHPYPILIRGDEISELQSSGALLGMMEDVGVEEAEIELKRGDKLFLFTDGLLETANPQGEEFEETFRQLLSEQKHLPVDQLLSIVKERLNQFSPNDSFDDDICLIFLELTEEGKSADHL